jgi:hypothetical protein
VLRGADTTAAHVPKLADQHRAPISEELLESLENDAIAFCPDMWSDPVRQVSYMGIATTFVNDQFEFRSYDLCCSPFEEEDKTAESIIAVSIFFSSHFDYLYFLGITKIIKKVRHYRFICS